MKARDIQLHSIVPVDYCIGDETCIAPTSQIDQPFWFERQDAQYEICGLDSETNFACEIRQDVTFTDRLIGGTVDDYIPRIVHPAWESGGIFASSDDFFEHRAAFLPRFFEELADRAIEPPRESEVIFAMNVGADASTPGWPTDVELAAADVVSLPTATGLCDTTETQSASSEIEIDTHTFYVPPGIPQDVFTTSRVSCATGITTLEWQIDDIAPDVELADGRYVVDLIFSTFDADPGNATHRDAHEGFNVLIEGEKLLGQRSTSIAGDEYHPRREAFAETTRANGFVFFDGKDVPDNINGSSGDSPLNENKGIVKTFEVDVVGGLDIEFRDDDENVSFTLSGIRISRRVDSNFERGDFNQDGQWDCADIDTLTTAIAEGSADLSLDMNGDGVLDLDDVNDPDVGWLAVAGARSAATGGNPFLPGDANLDGVVDVSDFNVWNGNKFTLTTGWCNGDFSADGVVDVTDFNLWNNSKFTSSGGVRNLPALGESGSLFISQTAPEDWVTVHLNRA
ncbi:MAG: hypothetical protein AAF497_28805, partial [Planctomycetota bacterium]